MRDLFPVSVGFVSCGLAWELVRIGFNLPEVVLPSLKSIFISLGKNSTYLLPELTITIGEALAGFSVGSFLACLFAFFFIQSTFFQKAVYPIALMVKATPLIVMAPIVILWFGSGTLSKIAMSSILCFFPVLVAAFDGMKDTDRNALELLGLYGASKSQVFWKAKVPSALPSFFSGLKVALPLAFVGAVIGEYLSSTRGIGYVIANASHHLKTPLMYGSVLLVSATGLGLFAILLEIEKRLIFWKKK